MNLTSSLLLSLLAAVGTCLPTAKARRRALAGPLLLALALASLPLAQGSADSLEALPASYCAVTAALMLIGLGLPLGLGMLASRDQGWQGTPRIVALGAALGSTALGLRQALPLARLGGLTTLAAAGALLLIAVLLRLTGPRLASGLRWVDALAFPVRAPVPRPWDSVARWLLAVAIASATLACLTPRLDLLLLAVGFGVLFGHLLEWRIGRLTRWPVAASIAALLFGVAAYLLIRVAADTPLTLQALVEAPYSPAFELLAVLLLGLASWILLGLFPFASVSRGALSPLLAGVLLVRLVGPVLPDGSLHWQPIFYLIPTIAASHAAATRRDEETLIALGSLGLLAESPVAGWCGIALVGGALLLRAVEWLDAAGRRLNWRGELLLRLTLIAGAPLLLPLLQGALAAQAFYTVVTLVGVAGSLFGTRAIRTR